MEVKRLTKYIIKLSTKVISYEWWGQSWCQNIENYADYYNRLERGRAYLRKGAIEELQIDGGHINALVSGRQLDPYHVEIEIAPLQQNTIENVLKQIQEINLLQNGVVPKDYDYLFSIDKGLFPTMEEIKFSCSCPDGAQLCKHVGAVLYAIGSILDKEPLLLFRLRGIKVDDYLDKRLIESTNKMLNEINNHSIDERIIDDESLSKLFNIDILDTKDEVIEGADNIVEEDIHVIELFSKPREKKAKKIEKRITKRNSLVGNCIRQYDMNGNFIAQFDSYEELESKTSIGLINIKRAFSGRRDSAGGYLWKKLPIDTPIANILPIKKDEIVPQIRPVDCFDDDGTKVAHYVSIRAASRKTGINEKSIREAAKGLQKHAGGYLWCFCDETNK